MPKPWFHCSKLLSAIAIVVVIAASLAAFSTDARARHRRGAAAATSSEGEEASATETTALTGPYVSACAMEPSTGSIIFDKEMHKPWPPASMTKMMLMLIVAEKLKDGSLKLADQITTSRLAAKMGGSQVYLKEGETFSLDDTMKAI